MNTHEVEPWWGLLVIGAMTICGCGGRQANADARLPRPVRLVAVESSTDAGSTMYSAVIAPNAQVALAFRVSGYVTDIRQTNAADGRSRALEPGAEIASGLTLARIRAADYRAVVDRVRGARDESAAGIAAAEAGLAEAQAAFTEAESDFGRISILWQQESITKPAYDGARARLDAARAKVDARDRGSCGGEAAFRRRRGAAARS